MKHNITVLLISAISTSCSWAIDEDPPVDASIPTASYWNVKAPPDGLTAAAGNGSTDDTAAIQRAINTLTNEGGIIFFPKGTYLVSSSANDTLDDTGTYYSCLRVSGKRSLTFMGTGESSRIRVTQSSGSYAQTDPAVLAILNSTNCVVKNLRVTGANKVYGTGDSRAGCAIFLYKDVRCRVLECYLDNANTGIQLWGTSWGKYLGNHIAGNIAQSAIEMYGTNNYHSIITENTIDGGTGATVTMGIRVGGAYQNIVNNTIRGCNLEPIVIEGEKGDFMTFVGNTVEAGPYGYGIHLRNANRSAFVANTINGGVISLERQSTIITTSSTNDVIVGNVVKPYSGGNGIYAYDATNFTSDNAVLANNSVDQSVYGIQIGSRTSLVIGNLINSSQIGIVPEGDNEMVLGNMIYQTSAHGIYADGFATNLVVNDNKIIGMNSANTRGVFINLANNDGLAENNDVRGFPLSDYLGTGVTYGYQSKSVLKLKPDTTPAAVTGTSYFDSISNVMYTYDGATWRALW